VLRTAVGIDTLQEALPGTRRDSRGDLHILLAFSR
jgi:hypothetical protein